MLAAILRKNICSKRFWMLICLSTFLMLGSEYEKIATIFRESGMSIINLFNNIITFDRIRTVQAGVLAGVCALNFYENYEDGYNQYCLIRTSPVSYACSWMLGNVILVMAATLLSFLLFGVLLLPFTPMVDTSFQFDLLTPYQDWVETFPWLYFVITAFAGGCLFSVLSLASMTVVLSYPNKYVAIGIPVILSELLYGIGALLPAFLSVFSVSTAQQLFYRGPVFHLIYTFIYFCILYLFVGWIFIRKVEKQHYGKKE